jgi:class 3 adenylate cyclase/tetratricopeptide (TPR) repeat protein
VTCPSCGKELPGEFPFCPFCAAPLAAPAAAAGARERKVVSVLFCDLVGFTAASESADPEEVQARVEPYHRRVRDRIEAYGGTVEKFIGDAVMAVFGAPVAHEDDAERAVRAGLAILDVLEELNTADPGSSLSVRVGVNTGEALVALDARPDAGEGMVTGDVVNTAARIQSQAPIDGVAVGAGTYSATERIFDYEQLEPIAAKGKSEPVPVWRAIEPRARFGSDVIRSMTTPLVGRELDLSLLRSTFDKAAAERAVQLVTVVGAPGLGKSRLVAELMGYVDGLHEIVRWRQGRCLPYGEGITFWALGEIVKAHAGVLESDSPEDATAKLEGVVPEGEDAPWLRARLLPLLGVDPGIAATRDESFAAWRRFLESMAEDGPAVLVFEDVHWADEALLAFLEHLADWATGVPLLLLCTARPELFERHPTWGSGLRNATTVSLAPLSDAETARLVSALLEQALLPAETQQILLERAGGNPLYAEEFVRMLRDRDVLDPQGRLRLDREVAFPESLHALIAARLDTLAADRKGMLQDAAVIGKVFWSGAVQAMGDRPPEEVERALHELARKELVRPFRRSSMEGEQELAFWHALVRDVAYGQVPRAERAAKHVRAMEWLERKAGERVEDLAEVLAHHTGEAIALARAAGEQETVARLVPAAQRYALLAGEKAMGLDVTKALQHLSRALELTPDEADDYRLVLSRWADAAFAAGDLPGAATALERVVALCREQHDVEGAADALERLSTIHHYQADERALPEAEEAVALLEGHPGPGLVTALAGLAGSHLVRGESAQVVVAADRALALAAELGLPQPHKALGFRGSARVALGDLGGLADVEAAGAALLAEGRGRDAVVQANNLAVLKAELEGLSAHLVEMDAVIRLAEGRGVTSVALRAGRLGVLVELGRLHEALAEADSAVDAITTSGSFLLLLPYAEAAVGRALLETGSKEEALAHVDRAIAGLPAGSSLDWQAAAHIAPVLAAVGRRADLVGLLARIDDGRLAAAEEGLHWLPSIVRSALEVGDIALAEHLCEGLEPRFPTHDAALATARAQILEARGELRPAVGAYEAVEAQWEAFGMELDRAHAALGRGRCLAALGDPAAEPALHEARRQFAQLGAVVRVAGCDALLAEVVRLSS